MGRNWKLGTGNLVLCRAETRRARRKRKKGVAAGGLKVYGKYDKREEEGMHAVLRVLLWLAVVYFALQAIWIIFSVVLCGGVGVWALVLWMRRHPWLIVVVAAIAAAVIIEVVL